MSDNDLSGDDPAGDVVKALQVSRWPTYGSRTQRALEKANGWVPPSLKHELRDALDAITVDNSPHVYFRESSTKITIFKDYHHPDFTFDVMTYNNIPPEFESDVRDYIRANQLEEALSFKVDRHTMRLVGKDLKTLAKALTEGHINKRYPEYAVDVDALFQGKETARTWTNKSR